MVGMGFMVCSLSWIVKAPGGKPDISEQLQTPGRVWIKMGEPGFPLSRL